MDRSRWVIQPTGDGELALVPPGRNEPRVVDDFVRHVDAELARLNRRRADGERVRLRIAVHQGVAYPSANGFAGQGVVTVSRLLNSAPLHRALTAAPAANVAVALSDDVFRTLVLGDHTTLTERDFRPVTVAEKEYQATAWVRVPGTDVRLLDLGEHVGHSGQDALTANGLAANGSTVNQAGRDIVFAGEELPVRRAPAVTNVFHGAVDASQATFGFSGGTGD
ncbi:hypothetical protein ACLQ29_25810 [Micromonospora sp. DT228]|uniref:hypothetical protein n=1 Tax=Micromonospora sp. DT228 TaxID=3393443 RepID=UPI003CEA5F7A